MFACGQESTLAARSISSRLSEPPIAVIRKSYGRGWRQSGIIRRHRAAAGSRWRKPNPGKQALLVLVYLRNSETFAELAGGFGVGVTAA
jgi:hypothetical protein